MCKGIIGKKLGMSGVFSPEGKYIPVTVVQAGPCVITQIKTEATDGYNALQLGFEEKKTSRTNKPMQGHFKKSTDKCFRNLREFQTDEPEKYTSGQILTVENFQPGDRVHVTGKTKGRGFTGVIKRHGFHGGPETHGSMCHRVPGSIGCSAWPSRVVKGKKLPGQYGNTRKTIQNLEVVAIRPEENLILLKGAVPGHGSGLLTIRKAERRKKN